MAEYTRTSSYPIRLWDVQTAPNAPCCFCAAYDRFPLQRNDFGTGSIQKELDLLLNLSDFEPLQSDDLVAIIYCIKFSFQQGR